MKYETRILVRPIVCLVGLVACLALYFVGDRTGEGVYFLAGGFSILAAIGIAEVLR